MLDETSPLKAPIINELVSMAVAVGQELLQSCISYTKMDSFITNYHTNRSSF